MNLLSKLLLNIISSLSANAHTPLDYSVAMKQQKFSGPNVTHTRGGA